MEEINKLYTTQEAMEALGIKSIRYFRKLCNKSYLGNDRIKRVHGRIPHSELVRISTLKS